MMTRPYRATDLPEWLRMRLALWPELAQEAHPEQDAAHWLARTDAVVLVAERPDGTGLAGFVEVGERDFADGCDTSPVAYLEGWYVDPDLRRRGIGTALVHAAGRWATQHGYQELASDALLENIDSQRAHEATGFVEVERAVRYRRLL
ncbi:MAG TPA: GNAT family N-acetyltransferase [Acidobacteriaceae bacterium]|nr:GNAT family N-acetyltransferase [Acidobacteriaceae bacterium]